jgi:hypothetical protein
MEVSPAEAGLVIRWLAAGEQGSQNTTSAAVAAPMPGPPVGRTVQTSQGQRIYVINVPSILGVLAVLTPLDQAMVAVNPNVWIECRGRITPGRSLLFLLGETDTQASKQRFKSIHLRRPSGLAAAPRGARPQREPT